MQQNYLNTIQPQFYPYQTSPNAVSINIYSPTAYGGSGSSVNSQPMSVYPNGFYPIYGQNQMPSMPYYPLNYNNMVQSSKATLPNELNAFKDADLKQSQDIEKKSDENKAKKKDDEKKTIIPLTDDYVKSIENYMNSDNPKIRLIGVKELLDRFKEDENRKDNPSLVPLLNKALRDTSPTVRFAALTALQLGYSVGNDETVQILKEIQASNKDGYGEDSNLASEILLKLSAPEPIEKSPEGVK